MFEGVENKHILQAFVKNEAFKLLLILWVHTDKRTYNILQARGKNRNDEFENIVKFRIE